MRAVTRAIAFDPEPWSRDKAREVSEFFDALAPEWHGRFGEDHVVALDDALERGCRSFGEPGGVAVDIGSGTGLATPSLSSSFSMVFSIDISFEMLRRADSGSAPRVNADGASLPFEDGSLDAVVLMNAFLFPREVDRVLAPDGLVVWVNSIGDRTPIHLPATDVVEALPGSWDGVESEADWGTWCVLRRTKAQ